ncbi:unnamed protein product [Caenorhabditis angaria]|uniref:Uncharacterized protein n=1 Tax=Caenorhabditis angaria TaxID=860376 RepID=A0A9P1N8I7_9PELO|nr:unnamed protein product [Caenorhabditis angaria]
MLKYWDNFYDEVFCLRRNSFEYLWSFIFRLLMEPKACEIVTFIGDGLRFKILDFKTLALLYYHPNDTFIFTDKEITLLFRSALTKSQAIRNCWADSNDIYDFTRLREKELQFYSGFDLGELLDYAYCVRPLPDDNFNH